MHHPTSLAIDLFIWSGSAVCLVLLAYEIEWHTNSFSNSQVFKEDVKKEVVMNVFMGCLVFLHFTLFVRHCVEVKRLRNKSTAAAMPVSGSDAGIGFQDRYEKPELDATSVGGLRVGPRNVSDAARIATLEARISELETQTRSRYGPHVGPQISQPPIELLAQRDPIEMDSTPITTQTQ